MSWSKKDARQFQREIRQGLERTAAQTYQARLAEINAEAKKQRSECGQELEQILERLDQAVTGERAAVAQAKADIKRAGDAKAAAAHRLKVAEETRQAKAAQKRRACKVEADAIAARRTAEKDHRKELKQIEQSIKARAKPLDTKKERRSEAHDEVESNLPAELVPLWRKVRRAFRVNARGEGRQSLTEAFERYAEEHPDEVSAAQQEDADRQLARERAEIDKREREERKREREERKRRGPRKTGPRNEPRNERRAASGDVPF